MRRLPDSQSPLQNADAPPARVRTASGPVPGRQAAHPALLALGRLEAAHVRTTAPLSLGEALADPARRARLLPGFGVWAGTALLAAAGVWLPLWLVPADVLRRWHLTDLLWVQAPLAVVHLLGISGAMVCADLVRRAPGRPRRLAARVGWASAQVLTAGFLPWLIVRVLHGADARVPASLAVTAGLYGALGGLLAWAWTTGATRLLDARRPHPADRLGDPWVPTWLREAARSGLRDLRAASRGLRLATGRHASAEQVQRAEDLVRLCQDPALVFDRDEVATLWGQAIRPPVVAERPSAGTVAAALLCGGAAALGAPLSAALVPGVPLERVFLGLLTAMLCFVLLPFRPGARRLRHWLAEVRAVEAEHAHLAPVLARVEADLEQHGALTPEAPLALRSAAPRKAPSGFQRPGAASHALDPVMTPISGRA